MGFYPLKNKAIMGIHLIHLDDSPEKGLATFPSCLWCRSEVVMAFNLSICIYIYIYIGTYWDIDTYNTKINIEIHVHKHTNAHLCGLCGYLNQKINTYSISIVARSCKNCICLCVDLPIFPFNSFPSIHPSIHPTRTSIIFHITCMSHYIRLRTWPEEK